MKKNLFLVFITSIMNIAILQSQTHIYSNANTTTITVAPFSGGTTSTINPDPIPSGSDYIWGMSADENYLYAPHSFRTDYVYRYDLDGTNGTPFINMNSIMGGSQYFMNSQVNSTHIFIGTRQEDKIIRADKSDGGNIVAYDFTGIGQGTENETTQFLAITANYLFCGGGNNGASKNLSRCDLDGNNKTWLLNSAGAVYGVAADENYVYWYDVGGNIGRANHDGSSPNYTWINYGEWTSGAWGILVDANYLYTINASEHLVRYDLDGTNPTTLVSSSFGYRGMCFVTNPTAHTWNGSTNSDWNTTSNWDIGVVPSSISSVTIPDVATSDPIIGNSATAYSVSIEDDAALSISTGNSLTTYNDVTVESGGSFIDNGTLTVNGSFKVERSIAAYTSSTHGWHLLSSPVNSFTIEGSDFAPTAGDDDLYRWDEVNDIWNNYDQDDFTTFENGRGYLCAYKNSGDKTFSGTPNNSDLSKSGLTYTEISSHSGWHLLGNPYPSALKWNTTAWERVNIDATAKIWKESTAAYIDITAGGTDIIPTTQGFMVHVTEAGTGSLTIDASDRTHNDQNWYKNEEINKIKLTAYDPAGNTAQESIIKINEDATTGIDSEYDSYFMSGYAPLFYSVAEEKALSTNTLPELKEELTIPLYFIKNSSSTFYIEAEGLDNLFPSYPVYLTDLKTDYTQNLNHNPVYSFTSEEGDDNQRFLLHFKAVGIEDQPVMQSNIRVWATNNTLYILNPQQKQGAVTIYNLTGQKVTAFKLTGDTKQQQTLNLTDMINIVKIQTNDEVLSEKLIFR